LQHFQRAMLVCEDRSGGLGPAKRLRVCIVPVEIIADWVFQLANAPEHAAANALRREFREEALFGAK
jgi:hypothetical protein